MGTVRLPDVRRGGRRRAANSARVPAPPFLAALLAAFLALPAVPARGAEPIPSTQAAQHVGERVTICGPVAGTAHFDRLKGRPTFLNFDRRHPDQSFTVVIWGENAGKFERPPHQMFAGVELCVTGLVELYQGKPQIVVRDPAQITVVSTGLEADRFSPDERILLKAMLAALGHDADPGDPSWDRAADDALRAFQASAGLPAEEGRGPRTLRALAEHVDALDAAARGRILKLLLLNLAQREEAPSR
jgi:hypothetical protein